MYWNDKIVPGDSQAFLYVSVMIVMIEKNKKEPQLQLARLMYVQMSKDFFLLTFYFFF